MTFSELRQQRAAAFRCQNMFDMLRYGIEIQIQQRRQRATTQVQGRFDGSSIPFCNVMMSIRGQRDQSRRTCSSSSRFLSNLHAYYMTDAEWRQWQLSVLHFPFRRDSLREIWRAWREEAALQLRLKRIMERILSREAHFTYRYYANIFWFGENELYLSYILSSKFQIRRGISTIVFCVTYLWIGANRQDRGRTLIRELSGMQGCGTVLTTNNDCVR